MATTINNIKVDFGLGATAPRVTFLQGADMSISNIRSTIRQIEESEEGRGAPGAVSKAGTGYGWIAKADGNYEFSDVETAALAITILPPFVMFFEAGATPFQTSVGSILGTFLDSPGAIVQINNAVNATNINEEKIVELWQEKGLDISNPLTVSATNRSFGSVSQTISGTDPVTVQRD